MRRAEAAIRLCEELVSLRIVDTLDGSTPLNTTQIRALSAGIAAFEHAAALDYLASEPAPVEVAKRPIIASPPPRKHSRKQKADHAWRKRAHPERPKP